MKKGRLEAFSDGVIAIIITIMVLEMKVPHGAGLNKLHELLPVFISYVLSFINVGIYWNNHHHLFMAVEKVDGKVLWANIHLLFWLSLMPFAAGWMGENQFAFWPVVAYGIVLMMAGTAYYILEKCLQPLHDADSVFAKSIESNIKEKLSIIIYISAILLALINSYLGLALYFVVAVMWLIPDKRIEKNITGDETKHKND